MPVFRRELHFSTQHPSRSGTGDWWHLVLDTDDPALYVEHTWEHTIIHSPEQTETGMERFGINDFLTLAHGHPAQPVLFAALREMFRGSEEDPSVPRL